MASNEPFGGISLVCFGDLLQLPPVKGNHPFMSVSFWEAKQRLGSVASMDLWQTFTYDELTINMRQSRDVRYGDLLSRARVGTVTDEDVQLLKQRMINTDARATVVEVCDKYNELTELGETPTILVPRTAQCDEINLAMLSKLGSPVQEVHALDTLDTVVDNDSMAKVKKAYEKVQEDVTRTAGLETTLNLCLGAKVMLKKNKDVEAGLVNGSTGTVVGFKTKEQALQAVEVYFHRLQETVTIQRESCSFEVLKAIYYTRKQFPLMLAFAITVHKSQGLSLSSAIIDAGQSCFGCGMVYVALSRVTSLDGLYLIDFDHRKLQCDSKAVKEYNGLRSLYTPHLDQLPSVTNESKRCTQHVEDRTHCKVKSAKRRRRDVSSHSEQTVQVPCSPNRPASSSRSNQHQQVALPVFQYSYISSLDYEFQKRTCEQLNLRLFPVYKPSVQPAWSDVTRNVQSVIWHHLANMTEWSVHGDEGWLCKNG